MKIVSLCSGVGGLELGLERAGVGEVVAQVEIDPYCRAVLARHWPHAKRFDDVRFVGKANLPAADVLCAGFPCQDVSGAGKGAGLDGARSGLWFECRRIVEELGPRFVVVENVASGKARWLPTVRGQLCDLGYRTRAFALSAADVGAPHLRRRVFVLAHRDGVAGDARLGDVHAGERQPVDAGEALAHGDGDRRERVEAPRLHADGSRRNDAPRRHRFPPGRGDTEGWREYVAAGGPEPALRRGLDGLPAGLVHASESAAAHGLENWAEPGDDATFAEQLSALGNAVVPQCGQVVGWMLLELRDQLDAQASEDRS